MRDDGEEGNVAALIRLRLLACACNGAFTSAGSRFDKSSILYGSLDYFDLRATKKNLSRREEAEAGGRVVLYSTFSSSCRRSKF